MLSAILLGHLKLPIEKIREAILSCDDTVLSEQHLKQLETFAPNKKEVCVEKEDVCQQLFGKLLSSLPL